MLNSSKSFLCIDFGAGTLKVAEFDATEAGALRLLRYAVRPLGLAGSQDAARDGVVQRALQEIMSGKTFTARRCNVSAPGFQTFSKFIKLPPVDASKATQIIQYEAQQNVPFPLEEVVWDYQILGALPSGELEVLLVAIKTSLVEGMFKAAESQGLRLDLVDASPAALANAFRYNYSDMEGCSMLLDIGAKTSNVLFFEKDKVYARTINIGANAITQEFAAEAKLPFAEAEKIKIAEGFVSLGGAYEEPENPRQAAISKIARQVMTRLHIQVNQTIQFYRSQQGGSAPQRVFLAGGASIMAYTAQFFAEKLNLPVDYFNPFRNVEIDPSVNIEELAKVAHAFGEVVGLGLRNPAQCPIELNLIPKTILKRQQFNQKKTYFIAAAISLILAVLAMGVFFDRVAAVKQQAITEREPKVARLQQKADQLRAALKQRDEAQKLVDQYTEWLETRFSWGDVLTELRNALVNTERLTTQPGIQTAVWVERMSAENLQAPPEEQQEETGTRPMMMDWRMMLRYGIGLPPEVMRKLREMQASGELDKAAQSGGGEAGAEGGTEAAVDMGGAPAAPSQPNTNEVSIINLTCRAISWSRADPRADRQLVDTLANVLLQSPLFVGGTNGTRLSGQMRPDEGTNTFRFDVKLVLAKPIKL